MGHFGWDPGLSASDEGCPLRLRNLSADTARAEQDSQRVSAGVKFPPNPLTSTMSIPDQYLADGGIAYPVPKIRGMAAKFGMRYEGVKFRDLIGGSLGLPPSGIRTIG